MAIELTLSADKLAFIIEKAREFDVEVEPDDPDSGSNAADDNFVDVLEDTQDNPAQRELRTMLRDLNEDEFIELIALVAVGRGDYDEGSWREALRESRDARDGRSIAALIATPMLGDLISDGLAAIGHDVPLPVEEEESAPGDVRPGI